ncbi:hypothetical protein HYU40_04530 [Candidatus Woesearchaeota archaeon]|nr:hypothetical protein [Candidatus Woesearchaeota archaeon]
MVSNLVMELEKAYPGTAMLVKGDPLDMWRLYTQPEVRSELTFYDTLSARDGLLFPDFFKAVHEFVRGQPFFARANSPTVQSQLEAELEETFTTMHYNWNIYEPFFNHHPELRYLNRHSAFSFALKEMADKLPGLRSLDASRFWSLTDYHRLSGNLDKYVSLDEELVKQQSIRTVFEKDSDSSPGVVLVHLQPDRNNEIAPYLRLLKHGDSVGFGSFALVGVEGKTFVAVTSFQTDLLRRDYVKGIRHDLVLPTTFYPDVVKNESGEYTVPASIRRPFLKNYAFAHKILEAVETAVLSATTGIEGVIVPTTSVGLTDEKWAQIFTNGEENPFWEMPLNRLSGYARSLYDDMPGKRGYSKKDVTVSFPLTGQVGKGTFWVASVNNFCPGSIRS